MEEMRRRELMLRQPFGLKLGLGVAEDAFGAAEAAYAADPAVAGEFAGAAVHAAAAPTGTWCKAAGAGEVGLQRGSGDVGGLR